MKVLFLIPHPLGVSPSQRFRFEQYFDELKAHGHRYSVQSFLNSGNWKSFFTPKNSHIKLFALFCGFAKRFGMLFTVSSYDVVFIHREAAPIGPPVIEWLLAKVLRKKIIYDFDDAIWITDRLAEPRIVRLLKWRHKVAAVCRWSYKVSCGNEYLCAFARQYNPRVIYNPTTVDCVHRHNPDLYPKQRNKKNDIVIGWTGSHSTLKYLNALEAVLQDLELKFPELQILVIADRKPDLALRNLRFKPWSEKTEIPDLLAIDIGIMPLPDDEWANGKCGFKAIQYMALEVPAVASPVGVNTRIIDSGYDGILCSTDEEWMKALSMLIQDHDLRLKLGAEGRKKIAATFSVLANKDNFLKLFE